MCSCRSTCRKFTTARWPLAIAILAAFCIVAPPTAFGQACQASGAIPIFPSAGGSCATGLVPGQTLDTAITLANTSSTTPLPGVPVSAVWTGIITVTYPVGDTFVSVGLTGCVSNDPGVASCTGVGNVVTITSTAGGVPLAAGAFNFPIATIRTMVGGPALPGCTPLGIAAATPFGTGITTTDPACSPQIIGGAQGSGGYNEVQCVLPDTCPGGSECATATCVNNTCGFAFQPLTTHCGAADTECASNSCDGAGVCVPTNQPLTTHCGAADTECASNSCNGAGVCVPTNQPLTTHCGAANTECQSNSCDGAGVCVPTNQPLTTHCGAADTECANNSCDGAGQCATTNQPATTHCGDADTECANNSCDGAGVCVPSFQAATTTCNSDLCQSCTGNSATCPTEDRCNPETCRTPGFWATHAGTEKNKSVDITQLVITSVGSLTICGQTITDTHLGHIHSAEEALCVRVQGDSRLQLARQLTAAALNCVVNGNAADCSNDPLFGQVFAACNSGPVCAPTTIDNKQAQTACIAALDCLNNGGHPGVSGSGKFLCGSGTCSDNQGLCTPSNLTNCADPLTATCNPSTNCHQEPLPGPFEPPGPAGSSNKCNDAHQNSCTIFSCP